MAGTRGLSRGMRMLTKRLGLCRRAWRAGMRFSGAWAVIRMDGEGIARGGRSMAGRGLNGGKWKIFCDVLKDLR